MRGKGLKRNIIFWCRLLQWNCSLLTRATKVTYKNSPTPTHTHPQAWRHIVEENTIDSSPQRHNWHFKAYSEGDGDWGRLIEKAKEKWNILAFFWPSTLRIFRDGRNSLYSFSSPGLNLLFSSLPQYFGLSLTLPYPFTFSTLLPSCGFTTASSKFHSVIFILGHF